MTPAILAQSGLDTAALQSMLYGDIDGYALSSRGRERGELGYEVRSLQRSCPIPGRVAPKP
jgi:hypothetical protein